MTEKIERFRDVFNELFSREIFNRSYIEILDQEDLIISANEEGFLSEQVTVKKICNAQIQSVTQFLYCNCAYIPAFSL